MIRFGFIGASTMAKVVVGPILKKSTRAEAYGLFSSSYERGLKFAEENGIPHVYQTLDEMLADEKIDAVYISSTNDLHEQYLLKAAAAGKHILCEKPLSTTIEASERMVRAAKEANVKFAVFHHQPALPQYRLAKKLIQEGKIGDVISMRIYHTIRLPESQIGTWRTASPEKGAGVFFDLTSHDVDTARFMLDDEIDEIFAAAGCFGVCQPGPAGVADLVSGVMRTKKGIQVIFQDSYDVSNTNGVTILGTEGVITANELGPYAATPAKTISMMCSSIRNGSAGESDMVDVPVEEDTNPFETCVEALIDEILGCGKIVRTGLDGALETAGVLTAIKSSVSGKFEKVPALNV